MLGSKFLKKGIKEESAVYTEFTRSSGWVAPDVVNMIAQLNTNLGDLQGNDWFYVDIKLWWWISESLSGMREKQDSGLQALLNGPLDASQSEEYFSDLKLDEDFIQKMLEVHVDLSDA